MEKRFTRNSARALNYMKVVKLNPPEKRKILGIGVIGESDRVRKIIGDLPLLK